MSVARRPATLGAPVVATVVALGAVATAVGGLGVGFRAAGFGYLGQSLLALTVGIGLLVGGLRTAARERRESFAELRLATVSHRTTRPRTEPTVLAPRMYSRPAPTPTWHRPSPVTTPARQRVHVWTVAPLELPPASAA